MLYILKQVINRDHQGYVIGSFIIDLFGGMFGYVEFRVTMSMTKVCIIYLNFVIFSGNEKIEVYVTEDTSSPNLGGYYNVRFKEGSMKVLDWQVNQVKYSLMFHFCWKLSYMHPDTNHTLSNFPALSY